MLEDPQPKQCCVWAKFAQNKGKTLCSLLVFTQLFRTRNKERSIFRSVYLGFQIMSSSNPKRVHMRLSKSKLQPQSKAIKNSLITSKGRDILSTLKQSTCSLFRLRTLRHVNILKRLNTRKGIEVSRELLTLKASPKH